MIHLDYRDTRPLYEQVAERFETLILRGVLAADEKLPSVRNLAMELSINPNTIQRAYSELERDGFIYTVKGRGNFVAPVDKLQETRHKETRKNVETVLAEALRQGLKEAELHDLVATAAAKFQAGEEAGND